MIELAESIISLKTQINRLTEENQDLRKTIEAMRSDDDEAAAAQRQSEAKLVQARTQAEVQRIETDTKAHARRAEAAADTEAARLRHEMEIEANRRAAESEAEVFAQRQELAAMLEQHPAMLRLLELEALRDLAKSSGARIYVGFDRPGADAFRVND